MGACQESNYKTDNSCCLSFRLRFISSCLNFHWNSISLLWRSSSIFCCCFISISVASLKLSHNSLRDFSNLVFFGFLEVLKVSASLLRAFFPSCPGSFSRSFRSTCTLVLWPSLVCCSSTMPLSKVELLHRSYKNNKQQHYGYLKIIGKKSRSQVQIIVLPILKQP